jgi:hypothetical protein
MSRAARTVAIALLLAPPAAGAEPIVLGGDLSGLFTRQDGWDNADHDGGSDWDVGGGFFASGSALRPRLLDWLAQAGYRYRRTVYNYVGSHVRELDFSLRTSLLGDTPLPMSLYASRGYSDFLSDSGSEGTGESTYTALGGTARLALDQYPSLDANVSRMSRQTRRFGEGEVDSLSTRVTLGAAQALGRHTYSLAWDMGWDEGTYAESNYDSQGLLFNYVGQVTDTAVIHLNDHYTLRRPTVASPLNPRLDGNSLGTGVSWRPNARQTAMFEYGYGHLLATFQDAPEMDQVSHAVSHISTYRFTDRLMGTGSVAFDYGHRRLGADERRSAGETFGAGVVWEHERPTIAFSVGGGATLGLVAPEVGSVAGTYGLSASGGFSTTGERLRSYAGYTGVYNNGGATLGGWALEQRLDAGGEGPIGEQDYLRASIALAASRREDDLFGTASARSATLLAAWERRKHNALLTAGMSQGLAPPLGGSVVSDGLFLPVDFNTETYEVALSSYRLLLEGHLLAQGMLRYLWTDAPGRPAQWEQGIAVQASYWVGKFTISLDERFSTGGTGDGWQVGNLFLIRLTRVFEGFL